MGRSLQTTHGDVSDSDDSIIEINTADYTVHPKPEFRPKSFSRGGSELVIPFFPDFGDIMSNIFNIVRGASDGFQKFHSGIPGGVVLVVRQMGTPISETITRDLF